MSLESILESRDHHYDNFSLYMHHTYCIENLYFYQDVQDYKRNPTLTAYQTMIKNYIATNAPHEINIPCDMRHQLLGSHTPHCFDEAAESILELIRVNSYLPWYQDQCTNNNAPPPPRYYASAKRNSLSPSMSFPDRCNLLRHQQSSSFSISRPSFSSVRSTSATSMFHFMDTTSSAKNKDGSPSNHHSSKLASMLQRKRQALMIRMKKTFIEHDFNNKTNNGFSWLAKK
ncbi:RGS domain-containing protein [Mucor lusitanicus]|uniref:RGS domain-containing protein n=2 Tax=Mucor circinelloides f. lusitanicus TaxID=29924 RepID=A0A168P9J8_MUCCL|nr:hypothetical protein MUCCIDRAFT_104315 [Mucor lusitanicus CBS 277.49]